MTDPEGLGERSRGSLDVEASHLDHPAMTSRVRYQPLADISNEVESRSTSPHQGQRKVDLLDGEQSTAANTTNRA
jgi:hypothetical protein